GQVAGHPHVLAALTRKQEGERRGGLVGLDDRASVVVPAVLADRVGQLGTVALRAVDQARALESQVSPSLTLAGMGIPGLGEGHRGTIIRRRRIQASAADRVRAKRTRKVV